MTEWRSRSEALGTQVSHLLNLLMTPQLLAFDAAVDHTVYQPLGSNDPEPTSTASDQPKSEMSPLM